MKTTGGFTYWVDDIQVKDHDAWEKAIKNKEVSTTVKGLELHAKTIKKDEQTV